MATPQALLQQMAQIQAMERGTLCPLRGGRYFNHQTWEQGRNVVRYIPAAEVPVLRKSLAGYQRFLKLTQQYADRIIRQTRKRRGKVSNRATIARSRQPH